ncbi:Membrane protein involved in the export of O-antigen and teichoic acid [Pustulibacterium marinum]|uniref:Membrane protein involved in the export of O-antigen and teichoic acid n=1 Tax=Pustulibacterium marinum TaxID=1224947 RepID=A0A1I7FUJ1_9FLAO|nr:oligosaccharide flippase family protein [Pustulibacterium marinum]SFU39820.1 Membrane protein involved in the export of O-antigen and teichoic acid [Pustulibacterium marinum]
MGVIFKQSFLNTISTYVGFAIGAINTLFLYTSFMTDEYYGLVGYMISVANILMPLMNCGVQNALVKFYSSYTPGEERNKFTFMMFLLPWLAIIPVGIIGTLGYHTIAGLLSQKNPIVANYVWMIYIIAASMAYFEVFYAWTKVQYQSVVGNFMKEVLHRVIVMLLLFALYLEWLDIQEFIYGMVCMYIFRMLVMWVIAFKIKRPEFSWGLPTQFKSVLKYSSLIILAGSIAIILLDIDKVMLGLYMDINNVAYYNVAVFIAIVIAVPTRAMQQITTPITARLLNEKNYEELGTLYQRSSINLYVVSGVIFLLIVLNIKELYELLPDAAYSKAIVVVFLISLAKLCDNLIGINNAIIFNSKYYRMVLLFGLLLTVLTVVLNMLFIPLWGMNGSGFATLLAFLIYNSMKLVFVQRKFGIQPFTTKTLHASLFYTLMVGAFFFWDFPFHPLVNIVLKSVCIVVISGVVMIRFHMSDDITAVWKKYSKPIRNYLP